MFLSAGPILWKENEEYERAKSIIGSENIVNDTTERRA